MGFSAILALVLPLLSKLPGMAGDYFKQKAELELEKLKTDRETEQARQQLAGEIARAQLELNKTMVAATGAYFKYFTFTMWFGPFMVGIISPSLSKEIFTNLAGMPEWYVQSCMLIMFTVWGISASAPVVTNIFTGLSSFLSSRREYKLEKARINRDAVFAQVKSKWFPKGMNQKQVNDLDSALDAGEQ